ncbi:antitoxin component YwqK of YwqJK toxin-antitoxin module [Mucilaginibacter gracilis]|uniref:Antitoxin component YwqK of YwqJK toxin-antitoxin module n=1 Tax=Mucilaginibacter gracilis TaxID=423350 RepID=A0A495J2Q6_9SPHI|nr:toxin-antitoxin system YwqK family antitoxin [Mucilaginibacter gracilis]RKR82289.1 antitoxin component YwqK of YwqJK toxin-antitoxin module [Mucilaginibacter gracilis]
MKCLKFYFLLFIAIPQIAKAQKDGLINSGQVIKAGAALYDSSQYKKSFLMLNKINRSDTNYVWSLYERAITCEADSQFNKAIEYCKEALALKGQREYEPDLYNTYGNSLMDVAKYDEALKVFDSAIAKYPMYSLLYFNKGIIELQLKHYDVAEQLFQKTLFINPYMYSAHYQLALAALKQGKIIQSFLSTVGYLLVSPQGRYSSKSITLLNQISKSTDEILQYKNGRTITLDANYQMAEEILLSKIALDKQYKPIIALDDAISRQIQVVFEKLEYSPDDKDFWIQYYLPYYKQVYSEGNFELFINHLFSSVKIDVIQDYNKKNKKAMDTFKTIAGNYFNLIRSSKELFATRRDSVTKKYLYEDGALEGKGQLTNSGKTFVGQWNFSYSAGNPKSVGYYNEAGKREGEWTYYFFSGKLKAIEHFKNGNSDGQQIYYYENGNLSSQSSYLADKPEGLITTYYYNGVKKSITYYKLGKKDGEVKTFYNNGNVKVICNYSNGLANGSYQEYYKSGPLKESGTYAADKLEGPYKSYYENGALSAEMTFSKDNVTGTWKSYYDSGKLKETRNYLNNEEDGLHQEYYENGQLSNSFTAKKGKMNGDVAYYDRDGKVYGQFVYEAGMPKSARYLSKAGTQLSSSVMVNNFIDITTYTPLGDKKAHFIYDKKGDINGPDTLFYPSGKIYQINQYKNGELNGLSVSYYVNGTKKSEINMTGGKNDGYYTSYNANGKPESEGWIQDGSYQGEWLYYNSQGVLSSKSYFLDSELNGYKEEYDPAGHKTLEQKYYQGWLEEMTQYDTDGKIISSAQFPKASGKYTLVYPKGQIMSQGNYLNGDFDGPYKNYFFDGSLESIFFYKKGVLDSTYTSYYFGGTKRLEGLYLRGNKSGLWKSYDEDGTLTHTTTYANDMINGIRTYYNPNGTKDFIAEYKDDLLDGLSQKYDEDGSLAYQALFQNDKIVSYTYLGADGKLLPFITVAGTNGIFKSYFANGKVSRECFYSDGEKNGKMTIYYTNGKPRSTDETVYGISEGPDREYYPDGKLKSEYQYLNDNYNGICKEYYKNGVLKKEITVVNGYNNGPSKYYNENGKLIKTMLYENGKLLSVTHEK